MKGENKTTYNDAYFNVLIQRKHRKTKNWF